MKKKMMLSLLLVVLIAVSLSAVSAEDSAAGNDAISEGISDEAVLSIDESDDGVLDDNDENVLSANKEVWIYNTTTEHVIQVRGEFRAIDYQNPDSVKEFNSSSGDAVIVKGLVNFTEAYSNWTEFDNNFINSYIQKELNVFNDSGSKYYIGDKSLKIKSQDVSVISNDTADNRRYRTEYDNDAVLIGDADYLIGAYGVDNDLTIKHIIVGNYSNVVVYSVKVVAEYNYERPVFIDNSVDTSNLTVYGTLNLKNKAKGAEYQENISLGPVNVSFYLDQKTVDNYSSQVEEKLLLIANSKASYNGTVEIKNFKSDTKISQQTGKVWDNRKYDQQGSVVIVSGDYGKETLVYVTVNAQIENDQPKEVWIDNGVDKSKTFVTGKLELIDRSNPSAALVIGLSNSTNSTYSNPDTSILNKTIDNALVDAKSIIGDKAVTITSRDVSATNSTWDYRRYHSEVDSLSLVIAHYIEGSYGRNVTYTAHVVAEYNEKPKDVYIDNTDEDNSVKYIAEMELIDHANPDSVMLYKDNTTISFVSGIDYDYAASIFWQKAWLKYFKNEGVNSSCNIISTEGSLISNETYEDITNKTVVDGNTIKHIAEGYYGWNAVYNLHAVVEYNIDKEPPAIVETQIVAPSNVIYLSNASKGFTYQIALQDKNCKGISDKQVFITFNKVEYNATTGSDGSASVVLTADKEGNYNVNVKFAGDSNYTSASQDATVKVIKPATKIVAPNRTLYVQDFAKGYTYQAILKDENGTPLSGREVLFTFNNTVYNATTDDDGWASVVLTANKAGSYNVNVKFAGDEKYASASQNATIKLVKVATKVLAPNRVLYVQDLAKGYTYQAILKTKDGKALANKKVLIRFNGKDQVVMTDDNGWVTVNLTANKAGKYDVTIKFAGDSYNDAVEETRSIKLIKETAYIIMKSGNFKANAQTKQVSATLKSKSGALISNAKVSVEVNGVTYIANTDANGVALINIKLTQTGIFDATWKFAGTSLYNARTGTSKITIR